MSIQVRDLQVIRGGEVLLDIDHVACRGGECVCIMGPNGAGKSLLLECLCGLLSHSGRVRFSLEDGGVSRPVGREDLRIGAVLQRSSLWPYAKTEEVIRVAEAICGRAIERDAMLRRMSPRRFRELSQGERQYIYLAMALGCDPELLVLDEAGSGLDDAMRSSVMDRVERLACTRILVLHNMREAARLCSRGYLVVSGRVMDMEILRDGSLDSAVRYRLFDTAPGGSRREAARVVDEARYDRPADRNLEMVNSGLFPFVQQRLGERGKTSYRLELAVPHEYA